MGVWLTAAGAATAVNVVLLVALLGIWGRNYRQFRSKHALALSLFAVLLLAENVLAFYYYVLDPQVATLLNSAAPIAGRAMMFVQVLELGALLVLTWSAFD
ncbi:hypothetical protein [Halorientalis regularis]|jgi:hypothetical protein|uniref:Uncharacterized protein n=1 Tax=Halorientalis regularis TaxID=660518 RepID=A0A1G7NWA1_9EURY|nr:hypothetical protein [Halorientalis regularis]SDF77639.1 hypothetical protein SAMN05216218_109147 [Halorientalis regularis]